MVLNLSLSPDVENYLRRRAAAGGTDLATCVTQVVERAIGQSRLDELLVPLRAEFDASGTTDDELLAQINEARAEYRAAK